mmetsp:Transcript_12445/g.24693  ORF Transcript_12445/g.24693 Transcript_12445/m.24693 type:complete len:259 (-) Transcript_12445:485-1261(-)
MNSSAFTWAGLPAPGAVPWKEKRSLVWFGRPTSCWPSSSSSTSPCFPSPAPTSTTSFLTTDLTFPKLSFSSVLFQNSAPALLMASGSEKTRLSASASTFASARVLAMKASNFARLSRVSSEGPSASSSCFFLRHSACQSLKSCRLCLLSSFFFCAHSCLTFRSASYPPVAHAAAPALSFGSTGLSMYLKDLQALIIFFLKLPTSRTKGLPSRLVATRVGISPSTSTMTLSSLSSLLFMSMLVRAGHSVKCLTLSKSSR